MFNIEKLIDKYLQGTATEQEKKAVDEWYAAFETNRSILDECSAQQLQKSMQDNWNLITRVLKK
jgi:hypothetical protein